MQPLPAAVYHRDEGLLLLLLDTQTGLSGRSARDDSLALASAYDSALLIMAGIARLDVPSRTVRRSMISAMLDDARRHGFDHDRLTLVAVAVARRCDEKR